MRTVTMTFTAPRDEVLAHMPAHREWMNPQYEDGFFLFSGLRTPALGGIVIASGQKSRAELDARLATDPLVVAGVGAYDVQEFTPSVFAPGYEMMRDA